MPSGRRDIPCLGSATSTAADCVSPCRPSPPSFCPALHNWSVLGETALGGTEHDDRGVFEDRWAICVLILCDQWRQLGRKVPIDGTAELARQIFVQDDTIDLVCAQTVHLLQVYGIAKAKTGIESRQFTHGKRF